MASERMPQVWHSEKVQLCGPDIEHPASTGGATIPLATGSDRQEPRVLLVYSGPANPHGQPPGTGRVYARTSDDGCKSWSEEREIIHHPECQASGGALVRDHAGALWIFYLGFYRSHWANGQPDMEQSRSDLWAARSFDEGETWVDNRMIFRGYTGATNDAKVTSSGRLIVPFSYLMAAPGRLVSACVVSGDGGENWELGEAIDIGQHGDHAGALEPVVVELEEGRIWMLIRTNLGHFLQAFSEDEGLTWSGPTATQFRSPSSPCHLIRLQSGRLAIIWNNTMQTTGSRSSLHMALSEDEGQTWTEPAECVRSLEEDYPQVSYPFICEWRPGEMLAGFNHVMSGWQRVQAKLFRVREQALLEG
jgi:hypothetical protein